MLRLILVLIGFTIIINSAHCNRPVPVSKAQAFSSSLTKARLVSLYFFTKTDQMDLTSEEIRDAATVMVELRCGNSCGYLMRELVSNFKNSTLIMNCPKDIPYLTVYFDDLEVISYFNGGKISKYDGDCFYNEMDIDSVIQRIGLLSQ